MSKQATKKTKKPAKAPSSPKGSVSPLEDLIGKAKSAIAAENWDALEQACADYVDVHGKCLETYFLQSFVAYYRDDPSSAVKLLETAMTFENACDEVADTLATHYALVGDLFTCVYYAKIAHTLEPSPAIKALIPASFPTFTRAYATITENPLRKRAHASFEESDLVKSEHWFRQHLSFDPKDRDAYLGMTAGMLTRGELRGVAESLRAGRHALPHDSMIAGLLAHTLVRLGKFSEGHACHRWAQKTAPDDAAIHAQALVDLMADPDQQHRDFPALFRAWGERFGKTADDDDSASDFFEIETPTPKDQLTIGFIMGSAGGAARGVTLSSILMRLDENRYQTVGFGMGALSETNNVVFQKCMGRWHDVAGVDPITLKAIIAAEEIDILVNVAGFTAPELIAISGSRLAPCQIAWMGTPYGTGIEAMDYLLTDSYMDPVSDSRAKYLEEPAFLELGSVVAFPLVSKQQALPDRIDGEFLFAADAKLHELTPSTIECWAYILHQVPHAKLILLDYDFRQTDTLNGLVSLCGTFGVANRVDIVDSSVSSQFFEQADACLMPLPAPSPQVAVDALWGGCPVICLSGDKRHTREAGSVLTQLGLHDGMVADTLDDYIANAVEWANNDEKRHELRRGIREKMLKSKSFDTNARAVDLQNAFDALWQKTCDKY
ncbi:MAG: hypothetical protein WD407_13680 [Rhodospirillales bacterium]